MEQNTAQPNRHLSVADAVAMIVGVVVGAGIFRTPSLVAANAGSEWAVLLFWAAGGGISLVGALCYAELASAYPHAGGDYHYLRRAFGGGLSFLFAWARVAVIQTGAIAMQAFLIGDYASQVFPLGEYSAAWYAAVVVVALTGANVVGLRAGPWMQNLLSGLILFGLAGICFVGLLWQPAPPEAPSAGTVRPEFTAGMAMIFVLLTYGGWNEAAYLSAEIRGQRAAIARALFWSIGIITAVYLLTNLAFLRVLGVGAMSGSEAVAADAMRRIAGEEGARAVSLLIVVAALSTINATIFTGARTNVAFGQDFPTLRALGTWHTRASTPANALWAQGAVTLVLIFLGAFTRDGFATMVEYTAPVFWFFLLMAGVSLFVLRRRDPHTPRPFSVPGYPFTPVLFCLVCFYMLRASIAYTGVGALVGVLVLLLGIPLYLAARTTAPVRRRAAGS